MRLTQEALKQIIKDELEVVLTNEEAGEIFGEEVQAQLEADEAGVDEGKHKGEGTMARSQLARTGEISHMLEEMIGDDTNLPEWVESKITKAQDYLSSVLNYMRGEDLVDAGDAAREMKATAAVVNRGPLQEANEEENIPDIHGETIANQIQHLLDSDKNLAPDDDKKLSPENRKFYEEFLEDHIKQTKAAILKRAAMMKGTR